MYLSRRRVLINFGALGATGLLAACGGGAATPTAAPPQAESPGPAIAPVASVSVPTITPVPKPQAATAASPSPSPGVAAARSPSPSPAAVAAPTRTPAVAGKQMYQVDAQHTGRSQYAGPRQGNVLRRFDTSSPANTPSDAAIRRDDIQSSSAVGPDGTIYIADFPGVLFALKDSPTANDQLEAVWRFHPPNASSLHATPALSSDGSTLYLGFSSGGFNGPGMATLYALKTAPSGPQPQLDWTVDLGATRVMASPTVGPDGTVYVGTAGGQLFAVASNGTVRWTAQTGPAVKSAPAIGLDGTVYLPSSDGNMYAVSPEGEVKWSFSFGAHLGPTPLVTSNSAGPGGAVGGESGIGSGASPTIGNDGTIFIGANNSNMYAVNPDGSLKWLFEAERELAGIWTTPALSADGNTIYFGANKGGVYALNTVDGTKRWQFPVYGSIYASSALDPNGVLYTATTIEHLYAIGVGNGEPLWDLDVHNPIWSAPSIRPDGTLVIADRSGLVQVIG